MIGREETPAWMAEGVCAQVDPELFFPEKGGSTKEAKLVCRGCPVQVECLEYAVVNDIDHGVWGGASRDERWALRRERRVAA